MKVCDAVLNCVLAALLVVLFLVGLVSFVYLSWVTHGWLLVGFVVGVILYGLWRKL